MKKNLSLFVLILFAASFPAAAQPGLVEVKQGTQIIYSFKTSGSGYRATHKNIVLDVSRSSKGYQFATAGKIYSVKLKEKGYKIYDPSGALIFKLKQNDSKLKILRTEDGEALWTVKMKKDAGGFKVFTGTKETGRVKFYPDKNKIKVKNSAGNEIAEAAAAKDLSAPAVLLFEGLNKNEALIIFTAMCLMD